MRIISIKWSNEYYYFLDFMFDIVVYMYIFSYMLCKAD